MKNYTRHVIGIGLFFVVMLFSSGYSSHTIIDGTQLSITGMFDGAGQRNWTGTNVTEIVNITIKNNESSTDSIVLINITIPVGFTLINSTIDKSLLVWDCANDSLSSIYCINNTVLGLDDGDSISVWFNVTSGVVGNEQDYEWKINTTDNATNESGAVLISWIDGEVNVTAQPDALSVFMKTQPLLNWTTNRGSDAVSGLENYTIYHSDDGENYTVNGTVDQTYYQTAGLEPNKKHWFKIETKDGAWNTANSSAIYTTIDTNAPNVNLNTTDNRNFTDTYYPRFYFNVTDKYDDNISCELLVDGNGNGTAYITNASTGMSILANSSLFGTYEWNVNCTDDSGNTGTSSLRTVNVVGGDVVVDSVYYNDSDSNLVDDSDIKVYALVKNNGNRNLTHYVTVKFYLDGNNQIGSDKIILNETITAGQSTTVNVTYTGSLKQYTSTFNHTLKAIVTVADTELSTGNNEGYNYSLYVGFNATIMSVDSTRTPGDNQTITIKVQYPNGTLANNLRKENFTIIDVYNGDLTHVWGGSSMQRPTVSGFTGINVYNDSFLDNGDGTYTFSIATYNLTNIIRGGASATTRSGVHSLKVDVQSNVTGKLFTGMNQEVYNLTAPMFDIIYKYDSTDLGSDDTVDESTSKIYYVYVRNNGAENLTDVNISVTTHDTNGLQSVTANSCSSKKTVNVGSTIEICSITVTTKSVDSDMDGEEIDIIAYGSYNGNKYSYDEDDFYIDVNNKVAVTQTTDTTNSDNSAVTASTDYPNCNDDDDCFGDEFCDSHKVCKPLDCTDDEEIVDHACVKKNDITTAVKKDYLIGIVGGPDDLEIVHGESRNVTFKIKNEGEKTLTELEFKLQMLDDDKITEFYSVISEYMTTVDSGVIESIKTEINTTDFSIGRYEIIAIVESADAKANKTFILAVTPNDDEKIVINNTMVRLDSDYNELSDLLLVVLHKEPDNGNYTELNKTIAKVKEYLLNAKTLLSQGNYLEAHESQISAESLMIDIKSKLEEDGLTADKNESHWVRNGTIMIILLIFGLFGFQRYNESQQTGSGYHHAKGFMVKEKKKTFNENLRDISVLKMMIKGKKSSHVKPAAAFKYGNYGMMGGSRRDEGIIKKMKRIFSKKKRNTNQKTLYDISSRYNKDSGKNTRKMIVTF